MAHQTLSDCVIFYDRCRASLAGGLRSQDFGVFVLFTALVRGPDFRSWQCWFGEVRVECDVIPERRLCIASSLLKRHQSNNIAHLNSAAVVTIVLILH
jgi:hypothetical protein